MKECMLLLSKRDYMAAYKELGQKVAPVVAALFDVTEDTMPDISELSKGQRVMFALLAAKLQEKQRRRSRKLAARPWKKFKEAKKDLRE